MTSRTLWYNGMLIQSLNCNSIYTFGYMSFLSLINFFFCSLKAKVLIGAGMLQLRLQLRTGEPDDFRKQLLCTIMTEYIGAPASSFSDWSHWSWRGHGGQKTHTLSASRWSWLPTASQIRGRMFSQTPASSEYHLLLTYSLSLWCLQFPLPPS